MMVWRPGVWLLVVPACLPLLNFSPWTGWLIFEEFDILLLGALAGGYVRLAWACRAGYGDKLAAGLWLFPVLLGGSGLVSLFRGFSDAGGFAFDWFAGYTDALNSVRVFKGLAFALLFIPMLKQELSHSRALASQRLASGLVAGLTVVTLAVLWERVAFPGLLEFSIPYRTVALFWEMHVGGGAIDFYMALTTPFVAWALVNARRPLTWTAAASLALLTGYAVLTTFSRGVYLAVAGSLLLLGVLLWAQKSNFNGDEFFARVWRCYRPQGWRARASCFLVMALLVEVVGVWVGGTFMTERLASTDRDLGGRVEHWQHGLGLLHGPVDGLLGIGLGRLPANYANRIPRGEFSGVVTIGSEKISEHIVNRFVTINGPNTVEKYGGKYALTQHLSLHTLGPFQARMDVRVQKEAHVIVELCERHLLYDGNCQSGYIRVEPMNTEGNPSWQSIVLPLTGKTFISRSWYAPRMVMLSLSVVNAGGTADFDKVSLFGSHLDSMIDNGDFTQQMAHWFPGAQSYFLPWHIDNLFLEVLIERGVTGLLSYGAVMAYALWNLIFGRAREQALSPYLAAALCAVLLTGMVSSLMDVSRVSFLFNLMTLFAIHANREICKPQ